MEKTYTSVEVGEMLQLADNLYGLLEEYHRHEEIFLNIVMPLSQIGKSRRRAKKIAVQIHELHEKIPSELRRELPLLEKKLEEI